MVVKLFFLAKNLFLAALIILLLNCSTKSERELLLDEMGKSISVKSSHRFAPRSSDSFYFPNTLQLLVAEGVNFDRRNLPDMESVILEYMQSIGGYNFIQNDSADFAIFGYVLYGNNIDERQIINRLGITPELSFNELYERGSLILMIKSQSGNILWRGAVQIYGQAEFGSELATQRIDAAIESLVNRMPKLK